MKCVDRRTALFAGTVIATTFSARALGQDRESSRGHAALCQTYIDAWVRKDLSAIGRHLSGDVEFFGPMARLRGRDAFLRSSERILSMLNRFEPRGCFLNRDEATLIYDFVCHSPIGIVPTAELLAFEGDLIRRIELFYDARPFEAVQRTGQIEETSP